MMELSYFALIGAPNCGKTVLFNGLTGAHAKVANYPGVTVDKREGALLDDKAVRIIDLPGTYSLRTTSPDEAVAKDVAVGKLGIPPDAIIAVADATNLRMTLRMILELKTLGLPMVVSLNMSDVARRRGLNIDAAKLSELLDANKLKHKECVMYRTVSNGLTEEEVKNFDYDMLVFFSPTGVKALKENIPDFVQGDIKIAAFGPATAKEVEAQELRLDLQAPSKEYPSMTGALRAFLEEEKKNK